MQTERPKSVQMRNQNSKWPSKQQKDCDSRNDTTKKSHNKKIINCNQDRPVCFINKHINRELLFRFEIRLPLRILGIRLIAITKRRGWSRYSRDGDYNRVLKVWAHTANSLGPIFCLITTTLGNNVFTYRIKAILHETVMLAIPYIQFVNPYMVVGKRQKSLKHSSWLDSFQLYFADGMFHKQNIHLK